MPDDSLPDFSALSPLPRDAAPPSPEPAAPPIAHLPVPPPPRPGQGTATILALVLAGAALVLSGLVALVSVGTLAYVHFAVPGDGTAWSDFEVMPVLTEGTVEDADGRAVDGVGTYDRPARVGEHTVSWPVESGGVLEVTVTAVDWEADEAVAAAHSSNPAPSPGMVYVQAELYLEYSGPGTVVPATDLWLTLETRSWACYSDELDIVATSPLWDVGDLADLEVATATVVFEMPEGERSSALLRVETIDGEPLYLAES